MMPQIKKKNVEATSIRPARIFNLQQYYHLCAKLTY